jgi:hypothetical protein
MHTGGNGHGLGLRPGLRPRTSDCHVRERTEYPSPGKPQLKSYLQQLLADRDQVRAATDLQDWARDQIIPREEEINQLRDLIRRIEADVDGLDQQDQALIAEAVNVIRKTRQAVNLGMPSIRPATATG